MRLAVFVSGGVRVESGKLAEQPEYTQSDGSQSHHEYSEISVSFHFCSSV